MIIIYKFAHYTPHVASLLVLCPALFHTHDATLISEQRFFVLMHKHDAAHTYTQTHVHTHRRIRQRGERERERIFRV